MVEQPRFDSALAEFGQNIAALGSKRLHQPPKGVSDFKGLTAVILSSNGCTFAALVQEDPPAHLHEVFKKTMKIGFFLNQPVWFDGSSYSANYMNLLTFFSALSEQVEQLSLCLPVCRSKSKRGGYHVDFRAARIIGLPFYENEKDVVYKSPLLLVRSATIAIRYMRGWDVTGCASPSLTGSLFTLASRMMGKPVCHLFRGDKTRTLSETYTSGAWRGLFLSGVRCFDYIVRQSLKNGSIGMAVGGSLRRAYGGDGARVVSFAPVLAPEIMSVTQDRAVIYGLGNPAVLMYCGRLSAEKGIFDLIEAMRILHRTKPASYRLRIVGDGPLNKALQVKAAESGLKGFVDFLGMVPMGKRLVDLYLTSDCVVLPSYTEGVPACLVEAMYLGIPVIATSVGSIAELLDHGECGILVEPRKPAMLAEAIQRLSQDGDRRRNFIDKARGKAVWYREENQIQLFLNELRILLPGR